jgi:hypothetical protein
VRRWFALVCLFGVLGAPAAATAGSRGLERFEGTFVYVGSSEKGARIIDRAITEVTDDMGFLKKGIANDRLDEALSVVPRIVIEADGDRIVVEFQSATYRSRVGGPWVEAKSPDGENVKVRHRVKKQRLIQEIQTDKGLRRDVFVPRGKNEIRIDVTVSSPKLPDDIKYDLEYRKKQ